jgi:hypothetical protein
VLQITSSSQSLQKSARSNTLLQRLRVHSTTCAQCTPNRAPTRASKRASTTRSKTCFNNPLQTLHKNLLDQILSSNVCVCTRQRVPNALPIALQNKHYPVLQRRAPKHTLQMYWRSDRVSRLLGGGMIDVVTIRDHVRHVSEGLQNIL